MSPNFGWKNGDQAHVAAPVGPSPAAPREATPAERATQARTVAGNLSRWRTAVDDACRDLRSAATPQAHAEALHRANQALTSLRDLARHAPEFLDAPLDDATRAALKAADDHTTTAAAQVAAAPTAPDAAVAQSSGHASFVAALPAPDSPRRQQAPEQIARLVAIIETELVFTDLDPLARALGNDLAIRDRFERLSEHARTAIAGRLRSHTLRQRLLAEHNDRIRSSHAAPEAPPIPIAADAADAQREVAAGFAAQLGVAPSITTGEPGRSATDARAAHGVAAGEDVALHPDVDPASRDGRRVIAHELVHQAQARLPAADADRADAEDEADALAEDAADGGSLQAPTIGIDLSRPAADKDAKAAGDQQLTRSPGHKYRVFAANGLPYMLEERGGRPGAWVVRDWVKSRGASRAADGGLMCPPCAREVLTAMGVGADRLEFAASALSFRFTGPITYLSLTASATHAVGLPPGQSTVVNRALNDALDVTLALDDPSIPPGSTHQMTTSEMQRAVHGAADFTQLTPEMSGVAFLVAQAAREPMVTGNGTLYFTMSRAFCQTLFGFDAYQQWLGSRRDRKRAPDPAEPKLKLENFYQQPIPGRLTNYGDLVESGERVRFEVKVDWPGGAPDPDRYAAPAMATPSDMSNVAMLACDWTFQRLDAPGQLETASTTIAEAFHAFRLGPGETTGTWRVTCHARFDEYFSPATFTRDLVVKTTSAHLTDLRNEAFADLGTSDVGRGGPGWKIDLGPDHVASRQVGAAGGLGDLMKVRDDQALDPQGPERRSRLEQLEAMREYLSHSPSGATAVAALEREIARRKDTEAAVLADRVSGRQPFQLRGTYLSRTEGLPSGPLDLVGSVHAVGGPTGGTLCHVTIRDLSRRFEAEDFEFVGAGVSFDDALADAFHKLAVAYPRGVVSIEAEELRATALLRHDGTPGPDAAQGVSTGKAIGFSRSTETTWKKVKETVWDPAVQPIVNAAAVALMTFLPFTAPFVIPTITAYNTVPAVDNVLVHADRGTLTTGRFATSVGEIALNVLPLAGTARVFSPGWFMLEAASWGGTALLFHQSKRDLAESLQRQHVAVLAEEFQAFVELRHKVPANDPSLAAMEAELHRKAAHLAQTIDDQLGGGEANLLMVAVATALVRNMAGNAREAMLASFQRRGSAAGAAAGSGGGAGGDGAGSPPVGAPPGGPPHLAPPHADPTGPAPIHGDAPAGDAGPAPIRADAPAGHAGPRPAHADAPRDHVPTGPRPRTAEQDSPSPHAEPGTASAADASPARGEAEAEAAAARQAVWTRSRSQGEATAAAREGTATRAQRDLLASELGREVQGLGLSIAVAESHANTVITVVFPGGGETGIKTLNDDLVGYAINSTRIIPARNRLVAETFTRHELNVVEQSYKTTTLVSERSPAELASQVRAALVEIDAGMPAILRAALDEATTTWSAKRDAAARGSDDRANATRRLSKMAALRAKLDGGTFHAEVQVGAAEVQGGKDAAYDQVLAAEMNATKAAIMTRDPQLHRTPAMDLGDARAMTFSEADYVTFARETVAMRDHLATQTLWFGGRERAVVAGDRIDPDILRALRKGKIDPATLRPEDRATLALLQRYFARVNSLDYIKHFTGADTANQAADIAEARALVRALESDAPLSKDAGEAIDGILTGRAPQADTASEARFYQRAAALPDRIVLNADIRDLGLELFEGYAKAMDSIGRHGADVKTASQSASDGVVRFKQLAVERLQSKYVALLRKVRDLAAARGDQSTVDALETESEMLLLLGGDEITISLHPAFDTYGVTPEVIAVLNSPSIANARVAVTRTDSTLGSGVNHSAAMEAAQQGHDALKEIEQLARDVDEAARDLPRSEKAGAGELATRLRRIYADQGDDNVTLREQDGTPADVSALRAAARAIQDRKDAP